MCEAFLTCITARLFSLEIGSLAHCNSFQMNISFDGERHRPDWSIKFAVADVPNAAQFRNGKAISERSGDRAGAFRFAAVKFDCRFEVSVPGTALARLESLDTLGSKDENVVANAGIKAVFAQATIFETIWRKSLKLLERISGPF